MEDKLNELKESLDQVNETDDIEIELEGEGEGEPEVAPAEEGKEDNAPEAEVESSDAGSTDDEVGEKKEKKKRSRNSAEQRIAQLAKERADAERFAQEQEQERRRIEEYYRKREVDFLKQGLSQQEELAVLKAAEARRELKEAYELGDAEKIANSTEKLNTAQNLLSRVNEFKSDFRDELSDEKKEANKPIVEKRTEQKPTTVDDLDPIARSWVERNGDWWLKDSDAHDAEKVADVGQFMKNLEMKLIKEGRSEVIGTKKFFNDIDRYIEEAWMDEPVAQPKKSNVGSAVAPQSRGAPSSGANNGSGKQKVTLSRAEMEMANSTLRDHLRQQLRREPDQNEIYAEYAKSKLRVQKEDPKYGKRS